MRGSRINVRSSSIYCRFSGDIANLFNRPGGLSSHGPNDRPRSHRRRLQIEPLESRHLMDAAGLASLVAPAWFAAVADSTGTEHAGVATWTAEDTIQQNQSTAGSQTSQSNLYDWIVQFNTAALAGINSVAETTSLLVGGGVEFQAIRGLGLTGMVLVRSSGASLDAVANWLANDVHVVGFEQDAYRQADVTSNDPKASSQWDLTAIDAQSAWSISTGSKSVVVAVIDTGVDYTHVDLAANIWTNPGEIAGNGIDDDRNGFVDDVHGYDFVNHDGDPMDDNSHGTHVAGTIAAVGNNSVGVTGVTWSTSIMALKFLGSNGSGYLSDAIGAINYATMMRTKYGVNVRVDNNSWGGGGFSSAMQTAIQASNDAGILFVAAAGNNGTNNDTSAQYPANYNSPNVVSVAATGQNGSLASFSNYGATTVDIAAPGVSIYSTIPGNKYAIYSGTSMATPHVAGAAALAWAIAPNASVTDVRNAILQGADPVASLSGKVACGGELNAYNTLKRLALSADDHGNNAATATAVGVPSATSGTIGTASDADWFKFTAVAGKTYVFSAQLGTLRDSTLTLYDRNGAKQLAFNDNVRSSNLASQIVWKATVGGTYYLAVASHGSYTGSYTLAVQIQNSVPTLSHIGDRTMAQGTTTLTIPLSAADVDGDALTYSAQALAVDPLAQKAYDLKQQLGLYQWGGSYWTNLRGASEKYLMSRAGGLNVTYFILPNGQLYRWGGSIAKSTPIATLSSAYYANPALLWQAKAPTPTVIGGANVAVSVAGNVLTIKRASGAATDFFVQVSVSDGTNTSSETFRVSVASGASLRSASLADEFPATAATPFDLSGAPLEASPLLTLAWMAAQSGLFPNESGGIFLSSTAAMPARESSASLHDDVFARLVAHEESPIGQDRLSTALDNNFARLRDGRLTDAWLTGTKIASSSVKRSAIGDELSDDNAEALVTELCQGSSAERRAVDEIFDLLASL